VAAGTVFWNPRQHRVRAGWRILVHGAGFWILLLVFEDLRHAAAGAGLLGSRISGSPVRLVVDELTVLVTYGLLIATLLLAARYLDHRTPAGTGFHIDRRWWTDLGFGLVLGAVLMALIFMTELALGWVTVSGHLATATPGLPFWLAVLVPLIVYVAVGVGEELWSRGYVLVNLTEGLHGSRVGPTAAIVAATLIQAVVFALLHAGTPGASAASAGVEVVLGLLFAAGVLLTGDLAIPIGLHISWNFCEGNVFGFAVNGSMSSTGGFLMTRQGGPVAWTGGSYGPEAGLLAVSAAVVGVLAILGYVGTHREHRPGLPRWPESRAGADRVSR